MRKVPAACTIPQHISRKRKREVCIVGRHNGSLCTQPKTAVWYCLCHLYTLLALLSSKSLASHFYPRFIHNNWNCHIQTQSPESVLPPDRKLLNLPTVCLPFRDLCCSKFLLRLKSVCTSFSVVVQGRLLHVSRILIAIFYTVMV